MIKYLNITLVLDDEGHRDFDEFAKRIAEDAVTHVQDRYGSGTVIEAAIGQPFEDNS